MEFGVVVGGAVILPIVAWFLFWKHAAPHLISALCAAIIVLVVLVVGPFMLIPAIIDHDELMIRGALMVTVFDILVIRGIIRVEREHRAFMASIGEPPAPLPINFKARSWFVWSALIFTVVVVGGIYITAAIIG
jgi:hypothetical protein